MTTDLIDVLIRTKNSEEFLDECLKSVHEEIPLRRIMIVDGGSTDRTLEIASSFDKVDVYVRPDSNLGQLLNLVRKKPFVRIEKNRGRLGNISEIWTRNSRSYFTIDGVSLR